MTDNGRMPELSLIAELKDPAIMETIKGMIPVPMQEMAPGQYALSPDANTTIYFGLNDNTFYATTDSDALVFLTGAQTSAYEAEVGKLFRGSYGTMFVDFPAVRSLIEPDRTEPARSVGSRIAHGAFVVRYAGDHRPYGASGRACPEYDG